MQLFAIEWELRFIYPGRGEAKHRQSNVRCREIQAELHAKQQHQRQFELGYEPLRVDDFRWSKRKDDRDGNSELWFF